MWHVKDKTGNMLLRLRDLLNNSIIPHLLNGSIIPVFQTWIPIQLLTQLLQPDTSQLLIVEKPVLCTRLPGKRNFVPVINHPEVLLEFLLIPHLWVSHHKKKIFQWIQVPKRHGYSYPRHQHREADVQPQNQRNPAHQVRNHTASTRTQWTEQQANCQGQ